MRMHFRKHLELLMKSSTRGPPATKTFRTSGSSDEDFLCRGTGPSTMGPGIQIPGVEDYNTRISRALSPRMLVKRKVAQFLFPIRTFT